MNSADNYLHNAEIAFTNKQYGEALKWYQKVLVLTPNDLRVLTAAGTICVSLGKFEEALKYFGHARELDPDNGDILFNYGNACFFNKDNVGAFGAYVNAEKKGCSDDVMPRLYYQMALLCSMRQDIKSSLVYFQKCEKADRSGIISLNPDLISEKLKLYLYTKDYSKAAECAAQLVAIQPTLLKNYMVYFSILMAKKDFEKAEKVLRDAESYAETTPDDNISIILELAALYAAQANEHPENRELYFDRAEYILERQINATQLSEKQMVNVLMTLADVYQKAGDYNKSIRALQYILNGAPRAEETRAENADGAVMELSPEEIEAMMEADMDLIQQMIEYGELSPDLGLFAETEYDEYNHIVPVYDETVFAVLNNQTTTNSHNENQSNGAPKTFDLSLDIREKVYFTLLTTYLEMDDFESARKYAAILKHSSNKYYSYYGIYTSALCERKLNSDSTKVERMYAEAIAFFRNKSFADHTDALAVILRARLYIEQGKSEKAKELAYLLADADRKSLMDYMEHCNS